jgi:hypothetical protein
MGDKHKGTILPLNSTTILTYFWNKHLKTIANRWIFARKNTEKMMGY